MSQNRKVAIIIGSSQGLGASIAKKLSKNNLNVVINYSSSKELAEKIRDECISNGVEAIAIKADVSQNEDCIKLVKRAEDVFGKVDILVNNAGTTKFADHSKLEKLSDEDFINIYKVNVIGPYQMIRAVEPIMKKTGFGAVVNISSIAGKTGIGSSNCLRSIERCLKYYDFVSCESFRARNKSKYSLSWIYRNWLV